MKVLFVTSEVAPYCKTGGLADVSGAFPPELARLGAEVRVVCPYYREVKTRFKEHGEEPDVHRDRLALKLGGRDNVFRVLKSRLGDSGAGLFFIDHPELYDRDGLYQEGGEDFEDNFYRFAFFSRAALEIARVDGFAPDVVHLNEWQTGLAAAYLKTELAGDPVLGKAVAVLTIHNLAYQGLFAAELLPASGLDPELFHPEGLEFWGKVSFLKAGIVFSDGITTVSPTYAREIQTPEQGFGLDGLLRHLSYKVTGILNGVDYGTWQPDTDRWIPAKYNEDDRSGKKRCKAELQKELGLAEKANRFLMGMVGRLTDQKGLDLVMEVFEDLMELNLQFVVLGVGDEQYHGFFLQMARKYPQRFAPRLMFDDPLAHRIMAGCDALLMPSRFEPCGLTQLYAMRYGTVPIVRATGGLRDTVANATRASIRSGKAVGFRFSQYDSAQMVLTVLRARSMFRNEPQAWEKMMLAGMARDFSWPTRARQYLRYYLDLTGKGPE